MLHHVGLVKTDISEEHTTSMFREERICEQRTVLLSSGMLCHVALVRTDISEELSASFTRVTRISELGTTLTVTSNPDEGGAKFLRNVGSYKSHTA
jgi:hypothetical protein